MMDHGMIRKGFSISILELRRCMYFGYAGRHLIV